MKFRFLHIAILTTVLLWAATSCIWEKGTDVYEDDVVVVSLPVENPSPESYSMETKATDAEERALKNLYVYIFNESGALKGFAAFNSGLNQSTSDTKGKYGKVKVKTTAGRSYIYAVANVYQEGTYPLKTTMKDGIRETISPSDGLPINLSWEAVMDGNVNFTRKQFLALPFNRKPETIQVSSSFLMTGAANGGNVVNINKEGRVETTSSGNEDMIRLTRVVSKVRFNIGIAKGEVGKSFKAEKFSIVNVACVGPLFSSDDAGVEKIYSVDPVKTNFNTISGIFAPNDVDASGRQYFEVYLPENKQNAVNKVTKWHDREADGMSVPKTFVNAPEYGTYVVIDGTYTEKTTSYTRDASVTYFVHLGDCTADVNDYNVERNSTYTFNVSISGVDNIIVEAKQENETQEQPGAEGIVMEYGTAGKTLSLDSHYEYMVMRFYQNDIKMLKEKGLGYVYQISDLGSQSDVMMVTDKVTGNLNGADTDWVEFVIGGTYSSAATERGTAAAYPGKGKPSLYTINSFLKLLYDNADVATFWKDGSASNPYVDVTCFIDENYYSDRAWSEYVNDVPKRTFYVANSVSESKDNRSVYATVAYGLSQYNIQTFYDRSQSGTVVAYGCETTNDEAGKGFSAAPVSSGTDSWNGRNNQIRDLSKSSTSSSYRISWKDLESNKSFYRACMSRNRDLNGDGVIDDEEIRWYAPTVKQYAGLWLGENVISADSRLYNKQTSSLGTNPVYENGNRMIYWTSTSSLCDYFAEEGMATNNVTSGKWSAKYLRCVRNLQSYDAGYDKTPSDYYTSTKQDGYTKLTLDKIDASALNVSGEQGELNNHNERQDDNKPAKSFLIASQILSGAKMQQVIEGEYTCAQNYTYDSNYKWRVPNQREFILMYLAGQGATYSTCRTGFSNSEFRCGWQYSGTLIMMLYPTQKTSVVKVRCISVLQ